MLLTYNEDELYDTDRATAIDLINWDLHDADYQGPNNHNAIYWFLRGTQIQRPTQVPRYVDGEVYTTRLRIKNDRELFAKIKAVITQRSNSINNSSSHSEIQRD